MILILGGTTEGRSAARVLDEAAHPFLYSTRGSEQEIHSQHGLLIRGDRNAEDFAVLIQEYGVNVIIDAAHPFAAQLHQHATEAATQMGINIIRYERIFTSRLPHIHYCHSYADAIEQLRIHGIHHLLALTGVQTIQPLKPYWEHEPLCRFRILDRDSSRLVAQQAGFPAERLEYFEEAAEADYQLMSRLRPEAIITKESGQSGFFEQKIQAAESLNIEIFVVERPTPPKTYAQIVDGEVALRLAIQRLLPDYYPQHIGLTTGVCATAAARAAAITLITGECPTETIITLPKTGEHVGVQIAAISSDEATATATVIKDGGDDPDATHGTEVQATVSLCVDGQRSPLIRIDGGIGVGRITLPGLGIPIGDAAINETPRRMIIHELSKLIPDRAIDVVISVPEGQEIASRTFNPRLGIHGGISIIGTTGVVRPFSSEAFVGSIQRSIQVAIAIYPDIVVINSGGKSEHRMQALYPELPPQSFVQYGNFIGATLSLLNDVGVPQIAMGIMIGKAVKLAEGLLDTHSRRATMNKFFLSKIAVEAGCSDIAVAQIQQITMARELLTHLSNNDRDLFLASIIEHCYAICRPLVPQAQLTIHLISE